MINYNAIKPCLTVLMGISCLLTSSFLFGQTPHKGEIPLTLQPIENGVELSKKGEGNQGLRSCPSPTTTCADPTPFPTLANDVEECLSQCNEGEASGPNFVGNNCYDFPNETTWFEFTAPASSASVDIEITSADLTNVYFTVFQNAEEDCSGLYTIVECEEGAIGAANVTPGATYLIAVSDQNGATGSFDICITPIEDNSACNLYDEFNVTATSMGSPLDGPFLPGETVSLCYTIPNYVQGTHCSWLQGVVPTFGDCWDPASFDAQGQPVNITTPLTQQGDFGNGSWDWWEDGEVQYNNPVYDVGAGWFFTGPFWTHPNDSWGDGNGNANSGMGDCEDAASGLSWEVCFDLIVADDGEDCGETGLNCSVSMKTYADGEIGGHLNFGCSADGTTVAVNTTLICCNLSVNAGAADAVCLGDDIQLNGSYTDEVGAVTIEWTSNPAAAAGDLSSTTTLNPTFEPTDDYGDVTFTLSVTDDECTVTNSVTITVGNVTAVADNGGPYCEGGDINLTSGGGDTYAWTGPDGFTSTDQNPTIINSTTAMGGEYTVTVTDANGCDDVATTTVVVNPLPVATADNDGPYCVGDDINLTSSGGTTYSWTGTDGFTSTDQNPTIINSTTAMGGDYTVTVTDINGCENTATTTVVVNPLPTATADNDGSYCEGDNINLTSSGGTTYSWTGPDGFTSTDQNPTITNSTIAMDGDYTVTVTDANGCEDVATTTVVVDPLPTATADNDGSYCEGDDINLTSSGGTTYSWTGPDGFTSTDQNPTITNSTTAMGGDYTVTVSNASGCEDVATTTVVVNAPPTATADNDGPYCEGDDINLTSSGGTAYSWTGPDGFASTDQNPTITNSTITMDGDYTVTVTDANGCEDVATTTVVVNAPPTATADNDGPYCEGDDINLTSSGGTTYSWTGPDGFTSTDQNPTITNSTTAMDGDYTVTVSNVSGCEDVATTTVIVNPLPTVTADNDGTYCVGDDINLTSSGGIAYSWTGPDGFTSTDQNPTINNSTTTMSGDYTVEVTDANGCVNSASTTVEVNTDPVANDLNLTLCEDAPGSGEASNNDLTENNPNINNSGDVDFTWYESDGSTLVADPTNHTVSDGDVYIVHVENLITGCDNTATINFSVTDNITLNNPSPELCEDVLGEGIANVDLNNFNGQVFSGSADFVWEIGPEDVDITDGQVINVAVTQGDCPTVDIDVDFTVISRPTMTPIADSEICSGDEVNEELTSDIATTTYEWTVSATDVDGATGGTGNEGDFINQVLTTTTNEPGTVTYTITPSNQGCDGDPVEFTITVNPIPNVIATPASQTICDGDETAIDLSSDVTGTTYSWTAAPTDVTGATDDSGNEIVQTLNSENGGVVVYTITPEANGCEGDPIDVEVTVDPLPAADDVIAQVCEDAGTPGQSADNDLTVYEIDINGSADVTYNYFEDAGLTVIVPDPTSVDVNDGDQFFVEVVDDITGCSDVAVITFDIVGNIVLTNPQPELCEDTEGSGTATVDLNNYNNDVFIDGDTYTWFNDEALTDPVADPTNVVVSNGEEFFVEVIDGSCVNSIGVNFTIYDLPTVTISGGGAYCEGTSPTGVDVEITLTGQDAWDVTYTIDGANDQTVNVTNSPFVIADAASGEYQVTLVVDANGCENTSTETVTVVENPLPVANNDTQTYCEDPNTPGEFSGADLTTSEGEINNTGNIVTWSYFEDEQMTTSVADPSNVDVQDGDVFYVEIVDANGCSNVAEIIIEVIQNIALNNPAPAYCEDTPGSGTVQVNLNDYNADVYANGDNYNWFEDENLTVVVADPTSVDVQDGDVFYVQVELGTCVNSIGVTFTIYDAPDITIIASDESCEGACDGLISTIVTGSGNYTYDWTSGLPDQPDHTDLCPGQYDLTVTDGNGCVNGAVTEIEQADGFFADYEITPQSGFAPLDVAYVYTGSDAGEVVWITGTGDTLIGETGVYTYDEPGTYVVTLIAVSGPCSDTLDATIIVEGESFVSVPNIFSPNGDGVNDEFRIISQGLETLNCNIFNRWGQLIYEINSPTETWKGQTKSGEDVSEATYFYILNAKGFDGEEYELTGSVRVVR